MPNASKGKVSHQIPALQLDHLCIAEFPMLRTFVKLSMWSWAAAAAAAMSSRFCPGGSPCTSKASESEPSSEASSQSLLSSSLPPRPPSTFPAPTAC